MTLAEQYEELARAWHNFVVALLCGSGLHAWQYVSDYDGGSSRAHAFRYCWRCGCTEKRRIDLW